MATITQTQLVEDALRAVGQIGPNDTADASDTTFVQRKLTALLGRLEEDGITDWDTAGDIPVERTSALQDLLVVEIGSQYGVQVVQGTTTVGERELRFMSNRPAGTKETVRDF